MSQIIDYDNEDIDKLSFYASDLQPILRERLDDDEIYFSNIIMSHYCFSKLRQ
ncbi:hypothetical protein [Psychrobacter sp. M13]|uniref:hypothetical protein n=1 Tax=Psychrobacter sp. M13 TaxID=3067275 RepID=UPI00273CF440|nr:hypothetical protein [Psychrobacter sp. M13]WLP93352.1 hypothetical protein Q9G97_06955 [Psychrobacter sp. M13]